MDELVATLRRQCVEMSCGNCNTCVNRQAADAIGELSRENESLAKSVNEASEILRKRWIPVTERLPEASGHYLICLECKCDGELLSTWMQVGWFLEKFYWEHIESEGVFKETVTHWMPLPEPPEEE